ncbi:hypothetical protein CC79DRAFT_1397519 [Sarocladium strictum]
MIHSAVRRMGVTAPDEAWRSDTEYVFDRKDSEAIVRTVTYHRIDQCLSAIWYPSREHDTVRKSITNPFPRSSARDLGTLDRLPLELLQHVFSHMDMSTILYFRQVSLSARETVDSTRQYRLVVSRALNVYYALLRTQLAQDITLGEFYQALCTQKCAFCNEFSGFISLLSWTRCCFKCLIQVYNSRIDTRGVDEKRLDRAEAPRNNPMYVSSRDPATIRPPRDPRRTVSSGQSTTQDPDQEIEARRRRKWPRRKPSFPYIYGCALPFYDQKLDTVDHGVCCAGCQLAMENDLAGGEREYRMWDARNTVYTRRDFLEHFRWCKQGQLLWESSDGGHIVPPKLPHFAREGGILMAEKCWHGE